MKPDREFRDFVLAQLRILDQLRRLGTEQVVIGIEEGFETILEQLDINVVDFMDEDEIKELEELAERLRNQRNQK